MRYLAYGGSFNPIHHGHLICARAIAESAGFDRVVLIPSAQPPHKPASGELASAGDRLAMCRLAARSDPGLFEVDEVELSRPGRSYTIDTVRLLKARGWPEVYWLLGADMVGQLPTWHEPEALLREVRFVLIGRPGWSFDWLSLPPKYRGLERNVRAAPAIDISGTEIRRRIAAGLSVAYLTPGVVIEYIESHGLYRAGAV